ncbi:hypothetical protein BDV95DRAFT_592441 [Massariosphaeria phaeospora]|uniref:Uncharacterized protein n=1 Tax=Massariosphaeria phaeospora TaxID=100035 RepID=A0A7C8I9Y6_9PLEO|nr:hypothetical protein BDV95DRAFT_592441 [Massariosphaeria phaeospora]
MAPGRRDSHAPHNKPYTPQRSASAASTPGPPRGLPATPFSTPGPAPNSAAPPVAHPSTGTGTGPSPSHVLHPAYALPPTIPSPYTGSLNTSLSTILAFNASYPALEAITRPLCQPPSPSTDWPTLLMAVHERAEQEGEPLLGRALLEEVLFLVTRVLLPEQVAQNRALLGRLYSEKRNLGVRMLLRYDLQREARKDANGKALLVWGNTTTPSVVNPYFFVPPQSPPRPPTLSPYTRPLFHPAVLATLIANPVGLPTQHVAAKLRHHVSGLDDYLLLSDADVAAFSTGRLLVMIASVVLQWQALRENTEVLAVMESHGWEELGGKAEDCEWMGD